MGSSSSQETKYQIIRNTKTPKVDNIFSDILYVNIGQLSIGKLDQLKKIRMTLQDVTAKSLFYYNKALFWKRMYWATNIIAIVIAGFDPVIEFFYFNNEYIDEYQKFNSWLIPIILSIFAFLNPSHRRENFEVAGDRYAIVAEGMYRDVFYANEPLEQLDLYYLLDKYSVHLAYYREMYSEPSIKTLNTIKNSDRFKNRDYFEKIIFKEE